MKPPKTLLASALIVLTLAGAHANVVTGHLWHVPEATAQNAIPANVPLGTPDVSFDVNTPMDFSASNATVAAWLASSAAFNITENTPGTLASLMDNFQQGTLLDFTGFVSVVTGEQFTVTHDDGLSLAIGGMDLGFNPGPTAPVQTVMTYTGPSGNLPFELVYGECCGGPAVLQVDLPFVGGATPPLPEPPMLPLAGLALLGAWLAVRRSPAARAVAVA